MDRQTQLILKWCKENGYEFIRVENEIVYFKRISDGYKFQQSLRLIIQIIKDDELFSNKLNQAEMRVLHD